MGYFTQLKICCIVVFNRDITHDTSGNSNISPNEISPEKSVSSEYSHSPDTFYLLIRMVKLLRAEMTSNSGSLAVFQTT